MDQDLASWSFWRSEYTSAVATATACYAETVAKDPVLQAAVAQAQIAELAIEARMQQLSLEADHVR